MQYRTEVACIVHYVISEEEGLLEEEDKHLQCIHVEEAVAATEVE